MILLAGWFPALVAITAIIFPGHVRPSLTFKITNVSDWPVSLA